MLTLNMTVHERPNIPKVEVQQFIRVVKYAPCLSGKAFPIFLRQFTYSNSAGLMKRKAVSGRFAYILFASRRCVSQ